MIGDRPEVDAFQAHELTADFTFVRFHHGTRGRERQLLASRARRVGRPASALAGRADVFAYFNNDWEGFAIENALYLKRRLGQQALDDAKLLAFANAAAVAGLTGPRPLAAGRYPRPGGDP